VLGSLGLRKNKALGLGLAVAAGAGFALFVFLPVRAGNLATGAAGWTSQGCFEQGAVYPTTRFDKQISENDRRGVTLWGSHCGNDASTGELRSPAFPAPTILELFYAGYIGSKPGLQLFLEREDNHVRAAVPVARPAGEAWVKLRWWTAPEVRGAQVRLVAVDQDTGWGGWLGVSNPRRLTVMGFWREQAKTWARTMATYLFVLALFLLPGFVAASVLTARRPIPALYLVMVVIAASATLGYISFWAFFFSKGLGRVLSFSVYVAAIGLLAIPNAWNPRTAMKATFDAIREPFLYVTLAGLCYMSFYLIFRDPFSPGISYSSDRFFAELLPGDNIIPAIFAERIYMRQPVRPFCCGDWLSSDRPPLQTGIVLLERPVVSWFSYPELSYELLASALQCFWICGVWCVFTSLGIDRRRFRQVTGFLIFSGFLFYNSIYTWPKLLASAFILFVLSILFDVMKANRALTNFEAALAGICLGLTLMSHPGAAFSLAVLGILLWRARRLFTRRQAAVALLIIASFYVPWSCYQKFVDPPGNRLLKIHLAGVVPVDPRTAWEAIRDSYHNHTLGEIIGYKWSNIVFMGGPKFFDSYGLTDFQGGRIDNTATEDSRSLQRVFMANALGLVNVGWLAGLFLLAKWLRQRREVKLAIPYAGWLIAAALVNLVFWSVVTFGPNETQTAHSSYADILLLSIGLLGFVLTLPRVFFLLLLAWQLLNLFVVWVWSQPERMAQPITLEWPMLLSGVGLTVVLVWMTVHASRSA